MADRVQCNSRRSSKSLSAIIENSISKTLQANEDIDNNEKQRIFDRFKEIYFGSIKSNVVIDGQRWDEACGDETAEFKPIDIEKKNYLNTTLVEVVYDSTLEVCGRRKKYPPKLTINCRKLLEAKTVQCVKTKLQLPDVKVCSHTVENGQKDSHTMDKLANSCRELTTQIKSVPDVVVKAERLRKSTDMFQNHKMTLPNGVLLNDSIVCQHEDTSLRSKLLLQLQ